MFLYKLPGCEDKFRNGNGYIASSVAMAMAMDMFICIIVSVIVSVLDTRQMFLHCSLV